MPKKTKYRKSHKGKRGGKATRMTNISFGSFGLKSLESYWVTARQIEAARRVMTKYIKRAEKFGLEFFQISRLLKKAEKFRWAKARARLIIMWR